MRKSEYLANPVEYKGKQGPFCREDLVRTTQLIREDVLFVWYIAGFQMNRAPFRPKGDG